MTLSTSQYFECDLDVRRMSDSIQPAEQTDGVMEEESKIATALDIGTGKKIDTLYSSFTARQKRIIVFLVAFAGKFSPLSSFIYYPALRKTMQ
jgi:hypothetical protein